MLCRLTPSPPPPKKVVGSCGNIGFNCGVKGADFFFVLRNVMCPVLKVLRVHRTFA